MGPNSEAATRLLLAGRVSGRGALDSLVPLVYAELHEIAAMYLRRERPGHTLQATAIVNEAYLRLIDQNCVDRDDRTRFFATAANVMKRLLVEHARSKGRLKRGGGALRVTLSACADLGQEEPVDVVEVADLIDRLSARDERQAKVVMLKFFVGLSFEEIGRALEISTGTAHSEWRSARAWLLSRLDAPSP